MATRRVKKKKEKSWRNAATRVNGLNNKRGRVVVVNVNRSAEKRKKEKVSVHRVEFHNSEGKRKILEIRTTLTD